MHSMKFHIDRQPQAAAGIVDGYRERLDPILDSLSGAKVPRVLAVGTGSSMNAITLAKPYFQVVSGIALDSVEPATFTNFGARPGDYDFILVVSQRGTSSSTLEAVDVAGQRYGCPVVAVTGHPESPLAQKADKVVDIGCGPEDMPYSTVGVLSTALTLMLTGLRIAERAEIEIPDELNGSAMHDAVEQLSAVVKKTWEYVEAVLPSLAAVSRVFLLGYGPGLGVVDEGALKVAETVRIPANSYELESFMHGPLFELQEGYLAWVTESPGSSAAERSTRLRRFMASHGAVVLGTTAAFAESSDHEDSEETNLLALPGVADELAPLLHLIPIQALAAKLSENRGVDLTVQVFPDFHSTLRTKVE